MELRRRPLPLPGGRGEGWGEGIPCRVDGPPLPAPLLPPREEREKAPTTSGCTPRRFARALVVVTILLLTLAGSLPGAERKPSRAKGKAPPAETNTVESLTAGA